MGDYKFINNVYKNNFILGGLVYHHKKITDEQTRNEEFNKKVQQKINENYKEHKVSLYELPYAISNIMNSQSLNEMALNKILSTHSNEVEQNPIEKIYINKTHNNAFISEGIKILDSDEIIFLSYKGIVGDIYNQEIEEQELFIRYKYDKEVGINIGEVYDNKLIYDYLHYYDYIEEMGDDENS